MAGTLARTKPLHTCRMRHLTSPMLKLFGRESSRRPRSCSAYSNTRNTLQASMEVATEAVTNGRPESSYDS